MASGTNYSQEYGQAEKAYLESNFPQAAEIIDHLADEFPNDPNVLLLRGHIYCYGFQNYDLAKQQYENVLSLSDSDDLLDFARSGIEQIEKLQEQSELDEQSFENEDLGYANDLSDMDLADEQAYEEGFESDNSAVNQNYEVDLEDEDADGNPFDQLSAEAELVSMEQDEGQDPFAPFESELIFPPLDNSLPEVEQPSVDHSSAFMMDEEDNHNLPNYTAEDFATSQNDYDNDYDDSSELEIDTVLTEPFVMGNDKGFAQEDVSEQDEVDYQDELEFDEIDSSFFDLEELEQGLPDTGLFNVVEDPSSGSTNFSSSLVAESDSIEPDEIAISEVSPTTTTSFISSEEKPEIEVKQGALAKFINAPIRQKQLATAGVTGLVSAIAVLIIGLIGSGVTARNSDRTMQESIPGNILLALVAGLSSAGTAAAIGNITAKHVTKTSQDLQSQFDDVYQGNLNAKATVYSQDEFGQLASGFNRMTRVILTTTQEAQRRAEETEQAKEDLQRQVIRLLDDVEGAARGDLTVQATVTADVLGAVADAFNLTIQSLREIVRQVKEAAEQVNQGSTDSELFARNQSSEALRMAEELAVTLNSVQMMTESIERVAENAREAEEVARSSSVTALKGGKAVERTVSGIFQIRETVSETARKVKRLAEASQEISKIVLLISQIAERTNQLALNASIQAAKAGEAGRGFAVVADEVRQLADRSGKSLKEIEQIVLQIQSETGSVMTAMEEGIQEVIDVTERAEQAKTALEDIIQVSNRIDTLVRSITADTVEQRENSRAVAQVMQSVELTAQATSHDSQRVGGALQSLVVIARGLLSSVERFRIDKGES
ncbi:MAG: HAMP domain-containing protein [Pleurocapsa sp. SU_5_0]|nr:HAMP domain-containing protein [Pleurocapsa sp. SU_5_0]NJR44838.1 HAMP domain-containing protein [Hyellaceae cyanobacterium CSU_1_1]